MAKPKIFILLLAVVATVISVEGQTVLAFQPAKQLKRLLLVSEWDRMCAGYRAPDDAINCRARIHQATVNGRSLGPFELVSPLPHHMLQSRSGVLFTGSLNQHILQVGEDTGLRTVVGLQDDVRCQAYAAAADLVGKPDAAHNYERLVKTWLSVYTDEESRIESVQILARDSKPLLQFTALTVAGRRVIGEYLLDQALNASVFSTCDLPRNSVPAKLNAEIFFSSIVGSARKFI